MGDRGNIIIGTPQKPELYLYTHDRGSALPQILKAALIRGRDRWDDAPYLTRIIFCEMVKGDIEGLTGYGILTRLRDNDRPLLFVDCNAALVHVKDYDYDMRSLSFSEYCELATYSCSLATWSAVLESYPNRLLKSMFDEEQEQDRLAKAAESARASK